MKIYEYCNDCGAYLGSAVWGLFHCPHCDAKLAISNYADNTDEDELHD